MDKAYSRPGKEEISYKINRQVSCETRALAKCMEGAFLLTENIIRGRDFMLEYVP